MERKAMIDSTIAELKMISNYMSDEKFKKHVDIMLGTYDPNVKFLQEFKDKLDYECVNQCSLTPGVIHELIDEGHFMPDIWLYANWFYRPNMNNGSDMNNDSEQFVMKQVDWDNYNPSDDEDDPDEEDEDEDTESNHSPIPEGLSINRADTEGDISILMDDEFVKKYNVDVDFILGVTSCTISKELFDKYKDSVSDETLLNMESVADEIDDQYMAKLVHLYPEKALTSPRVVYWMTRHNGEQYLNGSDIDVGKFTEIYNSGDPAVKKLIDKSDFNFCKDTPEISAGDSGATNEDLANFSKVLAAQSMLDAESDNDDEDEDDEGDDTNDTNDTNHDTSNLPGYSKNKNPSETDPNDKELSGPNDGASVDSYLNDMKNSSDEDKIPDDDADLPEEVKEFFDAFKAAPDPGIDFVYTATALPPALSNKYILAYFSDSPKQFNVGTLKVLFAHDHHISIETIDALEKMFNKDINTQGMLEEYKKMQNKITTAKDEYSW
jgi:hypothetical protein